MSLTEPTAKMSKSAPSKKSRICVLSTPDQIRKAIRGAFTDSKSDSILYDPKTRPGISNLLDILSSFDPHCRSPADLAAEIDDVRQLKELTINAVISELSGIRDRYLDFMTRENGQFLERIAKDGAERASKNSQNIMTRVKEVIGLGGTWQGWNASDE